MWTTNPYCALSDVHTALDLSSTADDTWITDLIVKAQGLINDILGFSFQSDGTAQSPATRVYDGNGQNMLLIDRCVQVVSVTEKNSTFLPGIYSSPPIQVQLADISTDAFLGPNNFQARLLPSGYYLKRLSGMVFQDGIQNYTVTGVFGFNVVPVPIQRACIRLAVHWYKMRDTNYSNMINDAGGVKQIYGLSIPSDVSQILEHYRPKKFVAW